MSKEYNIKEINCIKGIAILLVFIGHAATPSFLERPYIYEFVVQIIYSLHMALFFLVAGFLSYKVIDMKLIPLDFIVKKFCRLIIPFITVSFITNIMMVILSYLKISPITINSLGEIIKTTLFYPEDGIMGALWFLYTLFFVTIIAIFITKLPVKVALMIGLLLNLLVPQYNNFLSISRISYFLIYFLLGIYFRKHVFDNDKINIKNILGSKKIIVSSLSMICVFFYSYVIVNQIIIPKYLLSLLNFLCGVCGMILVLSIIGALKKFKILIGTLSFLGKYSMDIYLLSWFFQITSMILISKILKITDYNVFFISNMLIGSLCLPFSIYILRRFKVLKFLFFGEINYKGSLYDDLTISRLIK